MKRVAVTLVVAFAAACASATTSTPPAPAPAPAAPPQAVAPPPPPVAAFDPEGEYALNVTFGGAALPITLELWRENGQWRGVGGNPGVGSANLSQLTQDGRKLRVTLVAPDGPTFVMELEVRTDNTVTGTWYGNNDGSQISGRKTK